MSGETVLDGPLAGLGAQIEVRNLVAAYADAVNTFDEQRWAQTWHPDAVWDLGRGRVEGRTAIVDLWRSAMGSFDHVIQMVAHGTVSSDGTSGRWTIWELGRKDGRNTLVVGCYRDRYERGEQGWQFAERSFTATYRGEVGPAEFMPFPPLGV